jgi:anti-sigma factor (TIGR02949 family)
MSTMNFRPRECEQILNRLDAYLSNELLVETTGEVARHLENCAACSRKLESRTVVRDALRKAVQKELPPAHLAAAIRARIRKTQPHPFLSGRFFSMRALVLASLAVAVLAGVLGQQWLQLRSGRQAVAAILRLGVSDHIHCAIQAHNYPAIARPSDELAQNLGLRYAGLVPVIESTLTGFEILEAHVCSVPGSPRKYVHFIARGRGTILSVILTRRENENFPAARLLAAKKSGSVDLYDAKLEGMNVAGFETRGHFGFVVSDLGEGQMVQIAGTLALPLRNALSAGPESAAVPVPVTLRLSS